MQISSLSRTRTAQVARGELQGPNNSESKAPSSSRTQRAFVTMKSALSTLAEKVKPQVPLPDKGTFGRVLRNSRLGDFLGISHSDPTSKLTGRPPSELKGERIPGGESLYAKGKGMFHKGAPGAPDTYAFENTPAGIKFAADNDYASIDLDMHITKDGVPVATHWDQPMKKDGFHDPLGKLGENMKVKDMTLAEVMRLRNEDGQSQIYPMSTLIRHLKANGIAGDLEAKDDPRFATDQVMGDLADLVRDTGVKANLKSIDRGPGSHEVLKKAQEHGFWVRTAKGAGREAKKFGYGD